MRTSILLFALLLPASLAWAQHSGPTGQRQADKAENQFERTVPPPIHQQTAVDFEKLKNDADELVILSQVDSFRGGQCKQGHASEELDR
jgi:hypothetical protein